MEQSISDTDVGDVDQQITKTLDTLITTDMSTLSDNVWITPGEVLKHSISCDYARAN